MTASSLFSFSSSPPRTPSPYSPSPPTPTLSSPMSKPPGIPSDPMAAAADGLSKFSGPADACPASVAELAGDFLTCCGEDRGPCGEKTWAPLSEKGVETGGEAARACGVRPCWDGPVFPGVGVAMVVYEEA